MTSFHTGYICPAWLRLSIWEPNEGIKVLRINAQI